MSFDTLDNAYRTHGGLSLEGRGSNITLSIPENTSMAEILIGNSSLNVEKMNIVKPKHSTFLFKSIDTLDQMVQFSLADNKGLDSSLVMVISDHQSHIFSATIQYRFMDNMGNTIFSGINDFSVDLLPENFLVHDNYPNPFNPITTIRYELNVKENVKIKLIDIMGRTIKTEFYNGMLQGRHT